MEWRRSKFAAAAGRARPARCWPGQQGQGGPTDALRECRPSPQRRRSATALAPQLRPLQPCAASRHVRTPPIQLLRRQRGRSPRQLPRVRRRRRMLPTRLALWLTAPTQRSTVPAWGVHPLHRRRLRAAVVQLAATAPRPSPAEPPSQASRWLQMVMVQADTLTLQRRGMRRDGARQLRLTASAQLPLPVQGLLAAAAAAVLLLLQAAQGRRIHARLLPRALPCLQLRCPVCSCALQCFICTSLARSAAVSAHGATDSSPTSSCAPEPQYAVSPFPVRIFCSSAVGFVDCTAIHCGYHERACAPHCPHQLLTRCQASDHHQLNRHHDQVRACLLPVCIHLPRLPTSSSLCQCFCRGWLSDDRDCEVRLKAVPSTLTHGRRTYSQSWQQLLPR